MSEPLRISAGSALIREVFAATLAQDRGSLVHLIIDVPIGFAFRCLPSSSRASVVYTPNSCPEYLASLWAHDPTVLISGQASLGDVRYAIAKARQGERLLTPAPSARLTPKELWVLQLCANGLSSKAIASELKQCEQTVNNVLQAIYQKLGVKNRTQAALCFWDIQR
jgi:DNA-binding NarL/FixJ family response regulator